MNLFASSAGKSSGGRTMPPIEMLLRQNDESFLHQPRCWCCRCQSHYFNCFQLKITSQPIRFRIRPTMMNRSFLLLTFLLSISSASALWGRNKECESPCVPGDESIMRPKAHGTSETPVQDNLRWGCDHDTADRIGEFSS